MPRSTLLAFVALMALAGPVAAQASASNESCAALKEKLDTQLFVDPANALVALKTNSSCEWSARALYAAFAAYGMDGESTASAKALSRALKDYQEASGPESYAFGRILTERAKIELRDGKLEEAVETASLAERILYSERPDETHVRARVIVWKGVGKLFDSGSPELTTKAAASEFARARALLATPIEGAKTDPLFAEIIAWQAATAGQLASESEESGEVEALGDVFTQFVGESCAGAWTVTRSHKVRAKLSWAPNLVYLAAPYGVVVAIDSDAKGKAVNIRVLGEARRPTLTRFERENDRARDKELPRALRRWRANVEGSPASCLKDHIVILSGYDYPVRGERIDFNSQTNVGFHN
jgi:hypothetical protein